MIRPNGTVNVDRVACPHARAGLKHWHDPATWGVNGVVPQNGATVTLPGNTQVLVSGCSIPQGTVFTKVIVPATAELIFNDEVDAVQFHAKAIHLQGGKLWIGSASCRLRGKVAITLYGARSEQTVLPPVDKSVKGIFAEQAGQIEIHGAKFFPTWTRLATTANVGDLIIYIQDIPNWQRNQTIFIATTEFKDDRTFNRNEYADIDQVYLTGVGNVAAIKLKTAIKYKHYGGKEYQAEVSLVSRNVLVQGAADSEPTDTANAVCYDGGGSSYPCPNTYLTGFGAHIRSEGSTTIARYEGLELYRVGQTNVLGRYAIHFHMQGEAVPVGNLYVHDCSVHRSFFRAYAIHGTNGIEISENTAVDVIGHAYFLEDGVEERNVFAFNFGAYVHLLGDPSPQSLGEWYWGQQLYDVAESVNMILPSDSSASVFYITNSFNYFRGNAASGGWSGFAFPSLPRPVKINGQYGAGKYAPKDRPLLEFRGNSAHSTGYWWSSAGALYLGGKLTDDGNNGPLTYNGGRSDVTRDTCVVDPSQTYGYCSDANSAWMVFEDTKVFLASKGMQHWGTRSSHYRFESHDVGLSSNVFGSVYLEDTLINCRTRVVAGGPGNLPTDVCTSRWNCALRDWAFFISIGAFQWYDTYQSHIINNMTIRNCNPNWISCWETGCGSNAPWKLLTHSDQFVPQLMQISKGIKYENYDPARISRFTELLTDPGGNTVSGRLQSWSDADGSVFPGVFPLGTDVLLGSAWAGDWWKLNNGCKGPYNDLWVCARAPGDSAASFVLVYDSALQNQIGWGVCGNGHWAGLPCIDRGVVTHFGKTTTNSLGFTANARITGPILAAAGGGWYIRWFSGSPREVVINEVQIDPNDRLIIAIPYPATTTFVITATLQWCYDAADSPYECKRIFTQVNTIADVYNAFGDAYYFDTTAQLLYLRMVEKNDNDFGPRNQARWTQEQNANIPSFRRGGMMRLYQTWSFKLTITASNCGGADAVYCPSVPEVVPNPLFTLRPTTLSPTPPTSQAPTSAPSLVPTQKPTSKSPSKSPSRRPTTMRPSSKAPTLTPTSASTNPTSAVTVTPSELPTNQATLMPSIRPSTRPSAMPTIQETVQSTLKPTARPVTTFKSPTTRKPSMAPSKRPSKLPTRQPSKRPSKLPTRRPSKRPSKLPTRRPSRGPTLVVP